MAFTTQSTIGELLDNEATKAIMEKHIPGISTHPMIGMGRGFGLAMVAPMSGGMITPELLAKIEADLKALG